MAENKFEPSNVVQLYSGGPKMTVRELQKDGDYACAWFDEKQEYHVGVFHPNLLKKIEDGEEPAKFF
jgi:uncharacterized protein YodC (DUF2158 family)